MTITTPTAALLLTPREAAHSLSISERTLWTLAQRGDLPAIHIGRSVRYCIDDLRRYIEARRQGAER